MMTFVGSHPAHAGLATPSVPDALSALSELCLSTVQSRTGAWAARNPAQPPAWQLAVKKSAYSRLLIPSRKA